jgi:hypothetical protein
MAAYSWESWRQARRNVGRRKWQDENRVRDFVFSWKGAVASCATSLAWLARARRTGASTDVPLVALTISTLTTLASLASGFVGDSMVHGMPAAKKKARETAVARSQTLAEALYRGRSIHLSASEKSPPEVGSDSEWEWATN